MLMKKHALLLVAWLVLVGLVFIWTLTSYQSQPDAQFRNEVLLRHGLAMLLLTLPSGWLLTALVGTVLHLVGLEATGLEDALLVTVGCGIAGYLQWFVLLPWLWRRWRVHRSQKAAVTR